MTTDQTAGAGMGEASRLAFELYFLESRSGKGRKARPTLARLGDGTYADEPTQRHWWTWQNALAAQRERCAKMCEDRERPCRSGCA